MRSRDFDRLVRRREGAGERECDVRRLVGVRERLRRSFERDRLEREEGEREERLEDRSSRRLTDLDRLDRDLERLRERERFRLGELRLERERERFLERERERRDDRCLERERFRERDRFERDRETERRRDRERERERRRLDEFLSLSLGLLSNVPPELEF